MSFEQNLNEWYQNYLGRAPDKKGFDGYLAQLRGGRNIYEVAHEIQHSDEGRMYQWQKQYDTQRNYDIANTRSINLQKDKDKLERDILDYQGKIGGYETRIKNFEKDIDDYKYKEQQLRGQYDTALQDVQNWTTKAGEYQRAASDWENQFTQKSAEYEAARDEAAMYRNEAVGRQLAGLRSGATSGGSNAGRMATGTLASGKSGYQVADDKAVEIEKNIKAESGLLARKGPVVERIAARRSEQGNAPSKSATPASQSGSYYASRFGR